MSGSLKRELGSASIPRTRTCGASSPMETDGGCDVHASRPHTVRSNMTAAPGAGRDWTSCKRRSKTPIVENRQIRIHGADLGARSAIQSGSDHGRSTSKPNRGIR